MTPQERQLLSELFNRLESLERAPRDPDAVAAINDGLKNAPNALYPLVQTVLVQDEALKRADARIRELESELGIEPAQPAQPGSFLDSMREKFSAGREPQGSVPTVRPGAPAPHPSVWGSGQTLPPGYRAVQQENSSPGYAQTQEAGSSGGSFLGTAASAAAGVVGGALLMNSLRGLFGGGHQGQGHGALNSGNPAGMPWGSSGGGDLAREAGLDDIGRGGGSAAQIGDASQRASLFDVAQNDVAQNDTTQNNGDDFDSGDDDLGDDGDFDSDVA